MLGFLLLFPEAGGVWVCFVFNPEKSFLKDILQLHKVRNSCFCIRVLEITNNSTGHLFFHLSIAQDPIDYNTGDMSHMTLLCYQPDTCYFKSCPTS